MSIDAQKQVVKERVDPFSESESLWPECFKTGVVPADRVDAALCADGLTAWAAVMGGGGVKVPECFGTVLVEIGRRLGCDATSAGLQEASKRFV